MKIITKKYLELLAILLKKFQDNYYPGINGKGVYLIGGAIALIEQVINNNIK